MFLLILLSLPIVAIVSYFIFFKNVSLKTLNGRHVFITGGSKGIGLELAKLCIQNGAHVTIIARDQGHLDKIKVQLIKESNSSEQNVLTYSIDISKPNISNIERAVMDAECKSGPIYLLACCAGTAIAKTFADCPLEDFHKMMNINYFGTVSAIKACLPSLKKNPNGARILMFSSLAGVFGLFGYAAYSPSKFAIIGLAEVLDMELRPERITVTVVFPPDTDTPGYKNEQMGKPDITKLISEEAGLFSAEQVARKSLTDCLSDEFISTIGLNGMVLTTLCSGMMPTRSLFKCLMQGLTMGLLRLLGLHFLYSCEKIIEKNNQEKPKSD